MNVDQKQATQDEASKTAFFSRQALSAPMKVALRGSIVGFLASVAGAIAITIGAGAPSRDIITTTVCWLMVMILLIIRFRWATLLATLLAGYNLYLVSVEPYVIDSLINPKGPNGGYGHFAGVVLATALAILVFVCCLGTTIENYRGTGQRTSRWLPFTEILVVGMIIGALFIGALAQPVTAGGTTYTNGVPTVHMGAGNFLQSTITIPKGSKLLLTDDVASLHVLANGSWQNGVAQLASEANAPRVNNLQVPSGNVEIGPFTEAGTYHILCLVHKGMNLTIIVQ